jgi:hypothetical protein
MMLMVVSRWIVFCLEVIPIDATWMTQDVPVRSRESSISLSMSSDAARKFQCVPVRDQTSDCCLSVDSISLGGDTIVFGLDPSPTASEMIEVLFFPPLKDSELLSVQRLERVLLAVQACNHQKMAGLRRSRSRLSTVETCVMPQVIQTTSSINPTVASTHQFESSRLVH